MPRVSLNNRYYDMTTVRVSGFPLIDSSLWVAHVRSLKFGRKITAGEARGVHGIPLARTRGTQSCNCSMGVIVEAWFEFMKILKRGGINGVTDFDFDVTIDFTNKGRSDQVQWVNASILSDDISAQQGGSDGIVADLEMWAQDILINGVSLYSPDFDSDNPELVVVA